MASEALIPVLPEEEGARESNIFDTRARKYALNITIVSAYAPTGAARIGCAWLAGGNARDRSAGARRTARRAESRLTSGHGKQAFYWADEGAPVPAVHLKPRLGLAC